MSSIFYQRESKIYLFSFILIYNDLYVIISQKYISLNFLMKKYFWTPYWRVKFKSTFFYFYYSKKIQNLYSTQYKPNGKHHGFKMKFKEKLNLLSCVFVKNFFFLNLIIFHQFFFCIKYNASTLYSSRKNIWLLF
jgi:hypothetical protein